jgi:hypothetical protein
MATKLSAEARVALAGGATADLLVAVVDAVPRPAVGGMCVHGRARREARADLFTRGVGPAAAGTEHARQAVHDSHRAVADASQGALLALLTARGVRHKSMWINNSIVVREGTLALAEELAARDDVRDVTVDGVHNAVHEG